MGVREAAGVCKSCGDVMVRRKTANHVLHLLLTVFTAGLWLIVWVLTAIRIGGWRCANCGRRATRKMFR